MTKRSLSLLLAILTLAAVFTALPASAAEADEVTAAQLMQETTVTDDIPLPASEPSHTKEPAEIAEVGAEYTVATPEISSITNYPKGAKIKWEPVSDAALYRLFYLTENSRWKTIVTTDKCEYIDSTVKDGETRVYTLRALDEDKNFISDCNREGWSNTFYAAPIISSLENTADGVKLKWNKTPNIDFYYIYRKTASTSWQRLTLVENTTYTDNSAEAGVTYSYTLRTADAEGNINSGYTGGKSITFITIPQITALRNTEKGVTITWDQSEGAAQYRVFYQVESNRWKTVGTTSGLSYVDTTVKDRETRVYTVRCLDKNKAYASAYDHSGWSHRFIAAPKISSVTASYGNNLIKWNAAEDIAGYKLYRKPLGGSWTVIYQGADASYTDTAVEKGKLYAYTLRCLDEEGALISGFISNARFYKNGVAANGNISGYGFKNGYLMTGLQRVNKLLYCYSSKGKMYRDTIVGNDSKGYYYVDPNGVCCESREMRQAAEFVKKYCKGATMKDKAKYGYLYMAKHYPYKRIYGDTPTNEKNIPAFAQELFDTGRGTCYRFAAAYACVAKIAGYRSRFCFGMSGVMPHGWTELYVNGEWLICDVDANIPSFGFADYEPYMMKTHMWILDKHWYSELTVKNGKAIWGKKTSF